MRTIMILLSLLILAGCERYDAATQHQGKTTLSFSTSGEDVTRGAPGDHFTKLHVMLFDESGERAFATVKTQTAGDSDFGTLSVNVAPGTYTVVAVGHSSARTATLKSPWLVQFTASDGEKLTDTFCICTQITVARNRITTYRGAFFGEGSGTLSQSGFGFTVDDEWDGEEHYTF